MKVTLQSRLAVSKSFECGTRDEFERLLDLQSAIYQIESEATSQIQDLIAKGLDDVSGPFLYGRKVAS